MSITTFAAIDVGSFELSMKIFECNSKKRMRQVDFVTRRLDLGSGTYAQGIISEEKLNELCRTLKEFSDIFHSYRVDAYKAYATSAVREAENSVLVLDQIAQRTGIELEILSNSEQRFLHYKALAAQGESFRQIIEDKAAILDIGGGSIQLSLFDSDTLVSTQNLRLGVLRLQEMVMKRRLANSRVEQLVDEFASAQLDIYKRLYLKDREIRNLIVVDDYVSSWALKRYGGRGGSRMIGIREFEAFLEQLRFGGTAELARELDIPEEKVPLLLISAVLVRRVAVLVGAEYIWVPGADLCDGIAYEYAEGRKLLKGEHDFERDIVACAMNISKRYMGSRKRAETLEKITTTIFDAMKRVHGMGDRERLYLQLAAILHDCGKYISMVNIGETSYDIIMATEIIGLSHAEREIVANMVRFNHSTFRYYRQGDGITLENYLKIAKLTAILRLASGMDRSHKQKLKSLKAQLRENELLLTVENQEDIELEKGFFEEQAIFFREIFNVQPVLKQRRKL